METVLLNELTKQALEAPYYCPVVPNLACEIPLFSLPGCGLGLDSWSCQYWLVFLGSFSADLLPFGVLVHSRCRLQRTWEVRRGRSLLWQLLL